MKKSVWISILGLTCLSVILHSCKKKFVPTVVTTEVTNITGTTATSGGTITDEGSGTVLQRGICWSQVITPVITDDMTIEGGGAGTFISNMEDLDPASTYYVRAYAKNEVGIGYGMAMSFSTLGQTPAATTEPATNITINSATLNGIVNPNYVSTTITFEYGTTTSYGQVITATQSPVTGNNDINVNVDLSSLLPKTTYHYRIMTTNSLGITYGEDNSFTTYGNVPNNGLVAYYPFNGNADDQTENENHGIVNGATLTDDRFGNPNSAYKFDGINDDISGPTNNWPFYKSPRTISLWCSLKTLVGGSSSNHILDYGLTQDNCANQITYEHISGGGKTISYGAYYNAVSVSFDYAFNTWYNIVGTFDGTIASLYINGVLYAQQNKNVWNTLPGGFRIGSLDNWISWWNGEIDDIRIYNRVLSSDEILLIIPS